MNKEPPIYSEFVPDLYVQFPVKRFSCPSIAFLNTDFWQREGIDINSQAERSALELALLDQFAVSVPAPEFHPPWAFQDGERLLHADRYGAAQGALHGGSGRCGTAGRFNAKGVGRTPLCNMAKDWHHTHGCLWMEEAIREAIFSNVAHKAFPNRATPVVAIIDTGESISLPNRTRGERRAIAVRPSFLRLGHLERSIYFGVGGHADSAQFLDAQRTRQCLEFLFDGSREAATIVNRVNGLFTAAGEQIGFGQAHRLFQGDYHSSNISVEGALVDFGAFRIVPDWRRRKWDAKGIWFGAEEKNIERSIYSILFQCRKHLNKEISLNNTYLKDNLVDSIRNARNREFCRIVDPRSVGDSWVVDVVDLICDEFRRQQELSVVDRSSEKPRAFHELSLESGSMLPARLLAKLRKILVQGAGTHHPDRIEAFERITRWSTSLPMGSREYVQARTKRFLSGMDHRCNRNRRDDLIARYIDWWIASLLKKLAERCIV